MAGELQIGRLTRFIQKWANLKGRSFPVSMGSEVVPSVELFSGVENRFLDSWGRFAVGLNVPGVAANQSAVRFRNPVASTVMAVIEKLTIGWGALDTGGSVSRGTTPAPADLSTVAIVPLARQDSRGQINPVCVLSDQNNAAAAPVLVGTSTMWIPDVGANTTVDLILTVNQEITVLPNDCLQIAAGAVNELINVSIWWRERSLEDSEKT